MKILISIIIFLISILQYPTINIDSKTRFAKACESTNLYKNCNGNTVSEIICLVEKSYFVLIISEIEDNYKVEYNGVTGYVKKTSVKEITNTPSTPYPYNIKLTIASDCNFRSSPTTKSPSNNIIDTLRAGENNFEFVGRIFSDEAIDFGGTTWYFVKYNGNYGYIYNKYVKSISAIYENTEPVTYLNELNNSLENPISNTASLIIMIILFIPCIFILLILYIPKKIKPISKKTKIKKEIDKY